MPSRLAARSLRGGGDQLTGVVFTTPQRGDRECRIGHRPVVSDVGDRLHLFNERAGQAGAQSKG